MQILMNDCVLDLEIYIVASSAPVLWILFDKLPLLKLLENGEFNHLTIILTLSLTCGLRLPLNKWGPTR